jgi:hypothetical protein
MPIAPKSRYLNLPVHTAPDALGVEHAAIPARQVPPVDPGVNPYFHTVVAGETIELLAARYLGASEAWWMIADANPPMFPAELEPGAQLAIPTTASPGRVERTRSF